MRSVRGVVAVLAALSLAAGTSAGEKAKEGSKPAPPPAEAPPPTMTKVVVHTVFPGLSHKDVDTQPKVIYRAGDRWGRVEHPKNAAGMVPVVIVASPDAWFVDLAKKQAEHILDPGPTYRFRAPIVDPGPGVPKELAELEFGREFAFVDAHHGKRGAESTKQGGKADFYEVAFEGGTKVTVSAKPNTRDVEAVVVMQGQKVLASYRYDEYQAALPTNPSLFAPPKDVRIVERKAAKKR